MSFVLVRTIKPSKHVNIQCIVLEKQSNVMYNAKGSKKYYYFLVADDSGSVVLSVEGDIGEHIGEGDILKVTNVEAKLLKGYLILVAGSGPEQWSIKRRPFQDVWPFNEQPNISHYHWTKHQDGWMSSARQLAHWNPLG